MIWVSWLPSGLTTKSAPLVCLSLKYRRNEISPLSPGGVPWAVPATSSEAHRAVDSVIARQRCRVESPSALPLRHVEPEEQDVFDELPERELLPLHCEAVLRAAFWALAHGRIP